MQALRLWALHMASKWRHSWFSAAISFVKSSPGGPENSGEQCAALAAPGASLTCSSPRCRRHNVAVRWGSGAAGINDAGTVVGWSDVRGGFYATMWSGGGSSSSVPASPCPTAGELTKAPGFGASSEPSTRQEARLGTALGMTPYND